MKMNIVGLNLLVIAVVLALTAAFGFGLLRPGSRELQACHDQLAEQARELQTAQQQVGNVSALYASILTLDEAMRDFRVRLPADRKFGEFLSDVAESLKSSAVTNYVVQPTPARRVAKEKLPPELSQADGTIILPVSVAFQGGFAQLFEFLDKMEALPRLSHVERLKIVNNEAHPGEVGVEIVLHTYHRMD